MNNSDMHAVGDDVAAQCRSRNYTAAHAVIEGFNGQLRYMLLARTALDLLKGTQRDRAALMHLLKEITDDAN